MPIDSEYALDILREFLRLPHHPEAVLEKFNTLENAHYEPANYLRQNGYVYIPPTRPTPVLLVAHADVYRNHQLPINLIEDKYTISNTNDLLGADDRAGCAIIWLLKELGHGILILDGEESGLQGAERVMINENNIKADIINRYQFLVEFDCPHGRQYKCYNVGNEAFRSYIEKVTSFNEPNLEGCTDIVILAEKRCAVNLSCGYHSPHTRGEYLIKHSWLETLNIAYNWLSKEELPRFPRAHNYY